MGYASMSTSQKRIGISHIHKLYITWSFYKSNVINVLFLKITGILESLLYPQWVHIGIKLFSIQFFASWFRQLCQFIMDISSTVLHGREAGLATMSSGGQGIPGVCGEEQNQALREDLRPRHWSLPPADLSCRLQASQDNQDKSHIRQLSVLISCEHSLREHILYIVYLFL